MPFAMHVVSHNYTYCPQITALAKRPLTQPLRKQPLVYLHSFIHSFIHSISHSGYFYSASSSPLPLRGAFNTAHILCRSITPKSHRQLLVRDLPKVPTWRLEGGSNPRPFGQKAPNLPMRHQTPPNSYLQCPLNLSTVLHSPVIRHSTARVYSLIIISFSILASSFIHSEVLQPLLGLCCTSSLEWTPNRSPLVCSFSQPTS